MTNVFMGKTSYAQQDKCFYFSRCEPRLTCDCSIPLHLRSHEKKDIFSGSIVKIPAVSMHRFEGIFMHALWHNKENSRNIYLNRVTMYITSKSLGLILCKMGDEAV